jgi:hypothetical protein
MKSIAKILVVAFTFFATAAMAQESMEDVLYLKNGDIYRGIIIEQVPNATVKIQIAGGSTFTVFINDVQKITKEPRWQSPYKTSPEAAQAPYADKPAKYTRPVDSTYVPRYKKKKGYFFLAELRGGAGNGGVRIVNGYKFGRFGFLGIGVGIDGARFDHGPMGMSEGALYGYSNGAYLPIVLRYSGDILKTRITPFYYMEAGYAAHAPTPFTNGGYGESRGGPIATTGFGCKFNTKRRVNFNLNLNVTYRANFYRGYAYYYDGLGNYYETYQSGMDSQLFGNFCFGIGF